MYEEKPNDPLFVEAELTPLTEQQAAIVLRTSFKNLIGHYPSIESLAILWAQSALETGRWKNGSIYNWNFGNVKRLPDQKYTSYKCSEIINGKNQWFYPYHPQTFFAAWETAEEGSLAYLNFLTKKKRYAGAWQEVLNGNPIKYCAALKSAGYFTADLVLYTKGVVSLTEEFKRKFANFDWPQEEIEIDTSELNDIQYIELIPPSLEQTPTTTTVQLEEIKQDTFSLILEFFKNFFK